MARQVLPIVGAVIGGIYGGPQGAQWGYAIGSVIGNAVDPQVIKGPKLGEAGLQTSAEGVFRPIVFGTGAVKGNVICRGNRQIKKKRDQQGKGGPVTETERVYWTFAVRICEAKDDTGGIGLLRIWEDEKLVYDVTPESQIVEESAEFANRFRFYNGSDSQLPDPDLEAFKGAGNVPAYRGTAYAVFPAYDLTDTGERIKDYRWEVSSSGATMTVNALMRIDTSVTTGIPSPDGRDWSAEAYPNGTIPNSVYSLIAGPDRYLGHATGAPYKPQWTDNQGLTWTEMVCPYVVPRGSGCYVGSPVNTFYVPSDQGLLSSSDGGVTGNISTISGGITYAIGNQNVVLAWLSGGLAPLLVKDGIGFVTYATVGTRMDAGGGATASPGKIWYGGSNSALSAPEIRSTVDGTSTTVQDIPAPTTATVVTCMKYGRLPDDREIVLAGTNSGEIYRLLNDEWTLLPWEAYGRVIDIAFVGDGFTIASNGSGLFNNRLQFTEDGSTASDLVASTEGRIYAIAAYPGYTTGSYDKIPLSGIVAELCKRPGLPTSRVNVTELTDMVDGLVLADDYTYADAIRTLMPVYFYGASEHDAGSGYKLHFPKHGKPVVMTLTIDDFVSVPDKTVRQDAYERPRVLHLHYQSPTVGYAPAKASPSRFSPDVKVVGEQSIQVPVSFKDQDEAWQRADKILKIVWTGIAGEEEFSLPMSFLYLVPTDAVGISLRGQVRRMVFSEQSYAAGVIESKLVADRQGNYTSTLTGIPLPPPTPPPPSIVGPSIMAFGDWPALNDNNDRLLYYVGATGQTEAWHGAQVDRSTDGGASFEQASTFRQNTIMGSLQADITAASRYFTDTTNVVRVRLYMDDEIESLTDAQFNSEGGAFMLKSASGWEMIQYRDAEQDTNGDWLLTTLKRGQLNTDPVAHSPGDMFVLLDGVQSVDAVTAWLNADLTHRATSTGKSPDGVPTQTDTYTGASQREFPVASVSLSRAGDDITVSIIPRHRFGTESNPIRSINWERYTLEITDGLSVSVRSSLADTFTFDASALSSPITVSVAQRNRLTGDGPFVSESIA